MNKNQKKSLYESIMKSVSKTVKRKLNESRGDRYEDYAYAIRTILDENCDERTKEDVIDNIHMMLVDIRGMVDDLNDGNISYPEVNAIFTKINRMIEGE